MDGGIPVNLSPVDMSDKVTMIYSKKWTVFGVLIEDT